MATKAEKKALLKLLEELKTARLWFDDTAYPRRSRQSFEEAMDDVDNAFHLNGEFKPRSLSNKQSS